MLKLIESIISSLVVSPVYHNQAGFNLKDYCVIISGASGGIGKALAKVLHREGANLVLVSRKVNTDKEFLSWDLNRVLTVNADIRNEKAAQRIISKALAKFGRVDLLINCAGLFSQKPLEKVSSVDFARVMDTNVYGIFTMVKAVVPVMKKQKNGLIINMGSKISHNSNILPGRILYASSKYAVEGFSSALSKELKRYGIRVTCLMPATVGTFPTLRPEKYLSPYDVAGIILMIVKFKNVDFESLVFKSKLQNI